MAARANSHEIASVRDSPSFDLMSHAGGGCRRLARRAPALAVALRRRVVAAVEAGRSRRPAAARVGGGGSAARRGVPQSRRTGALSPQPRGGRRPGRMAEQGALLRAWGAAAPARPLQASAAKLEATGGSRPPPRVGHGVFKRRATKASPRDRVGPAGCRTPASGRVRRPARARPRAPALHRRKRDLSQAGPQIWARARPPGPQEDPHPGCRPPSRRRGHPHAPRRGDARGRLPGRWRTGLGSAPEARPQRPPRPPVGPPAPSPAGKPARPQGLAACSCRPPAPTSPQGNRF